MSAAAAAFGAFNGSGCYCLNALGEEALLDLGGREELLKNLHEQDKELSFNLMAHMVRYSVLCAVHRPSRLPRTSPDLH